MWALCRSNHSEFSPKPKESVELKTIADPPKVKMKSAFAHAKLFERYSNVT